MENNIEHLKYPIGKFQSPETIDKAQTNQWIKIVKDFPKKLKIEVANLNDFDLKKQYRPNGWNIKQLVHHCTDSHINSFIRFKLALTEDNPTIKPYFENLWAELPDSKDSPIAGSIKILEGLHNRWTHLLKSLSESDLNKTFYHPETKELINLKTNIGIYAWHCEHHLAHIKIAKKN